MKKIIILVSLILLSSCAEISKGGDVETIEVIFSPVFDSERILTAVKPLEEHLVEYFHNNGFQNLKSINFEVAVSQIAAAEALASGSVLVAYLPPTTFVSIESESVEAILVGLRKKSNVDSLDPMDWNNNSPNYLIDSEYVGYFYGNIIAGPSPKGQELIRYIDNNQEVPWEALKETTFCMGSNVTSGLTYIYPNLWLKEKYDSSFNDVNALLPLSNLSEIIASIASETCDVGIVSSNTRDDYQDDWTTLLARDVSIWEETRVIGVTKQIESAVFAISKVNTSFSEEIKNTFIDAMVTISRTETGMNSLRQLNLEGIDLIPENYLISSRDAYNFSINK